MAELPSNIQFPETIDEVRRRLLKEQASPAIRTATLLSHLPPEPVDPPAGPPSAQNSFDETGELRSHSPQAPGPNISAYTGLVKYEFSPAFDEIDNLVDVWNLIAPETTLYDWQYEELLRMSGYVTGRLSGPRIHWDPQNPYKSTLCCANGSGKDMTLITPAVIGLPLLYRDMFCVVTSASYEQLKYQTSNHIERGLASLHKRLGVKVYDSVEFNHRCKARGGEIKLHVTDEAGRAEGWHPFTPIGRLALFINEAKSIGESMMTAFDRCWGYSHWAEISSPGMRAGSFYKNFTTSPTPYPAAAEPHKYFARRVTWRDCKHISGEHYLAMLAKHGAGSFFIETSMEANFFEQEDEVIVPTALIKRGPQPQADMDDIAIGLDSGAGVDESTCYVRAGARLLASKFFIHKNTTTTAAVIDEFLTPYRFMKYTFKADDGGVSRGILDQLQLLGWKISRCNNNSPARDKQKYENLGTEMAFHVRDLLERGLITVPNDQILHNQLTTRKYTMSATGKKAAESKRDMKKRGLKSPDRADGYALCYFTYRPQRPVYVAPDAPPETMDETAFYTKLLSDPNFLDNLMAKANKPPIAGTYTLQTQ